MRQERRDDGPTPCGGSYSLVSWDEDSGDADILECDARGRVLRRHEWRHFAGLPTPDGVIGEVTSFDGDGREVNRRPLRHGRPGCRGASPPGAT